MKLLRTPDEGPSEASPVLLIHGEPSWSCLYRKMIPVLVGAGHRCIAPDLVGFGRSDKPSEISDYSYQRHADWMSEREKRRLLSRSDRSRRSHGGVGHRRSCSCTWQARA